MWMLMQTETRKAWSSREIGHLVQVLFTDGTISGWLFYPISFYSDGALDGELRRNGRFVSAGWH